MVIYKLPTKLREARKKPRGSGLFTCPQQRVKNPPDRIHLPLENRKLKSLTLFHLNGQIHLPLSIYINTAQRVSTLCSLLSTLYRNFSFTTIKKPLSLLSSCERFNGGLWGFSVGSKRQVHQVALISAAKGR